jgi:hypothetical protein
VSSTPKKKQLEDWIEDAARRVACDLRLPWKLHELREHGRRGVDKAFREPGRGSGLSFPQQIQRHISEEVRKGGKSMRDQEYAQGGKRELPTDERIKDALETFSVEDWRGLIAEFGREDLDPLRDYLDANRDELEGRPNWKKKYEGVLVKAIKRNMILKLSHPKAKLVDITDPF